MGTKRKEKESRICALCEYSTEVPVSDRDDLFVCKMKGLVEARHCCRHFSSDPLKRIPQRREGMAEYNPVKID